MMDKWEETRVWWDGEGSWVVTSFDSEGNVVTRDLNEHHRIDSAHYAMKYDAVETAREYKRSGRCKRLVIETKKC